MSLLLGVLANKKSPQVEELLQAAIDGTIILTRLCGEIPAFKQCLDVLAVGELLIVARNQANYATKTLMEKIRRSLKEWPSECHEVPPIDTYQLYPTRICESMNHSMDWTRQTDLELDSQFELDEEIDKYFLENSFPFYTPPLLTVDGGDGANTDVPLSGTSCKNSLGP
jgi:hypothetical protein